MGVIGPGRVEMEGSREGPRRLAPLVLLFSIGFVHPAGLVGQRLVGEVVDAESRTPLVGALVVAHDGANEVAGVAFADSLGRYSLRLQGHGPYRVSAQALGYASLEASDLRFTEDLPTLLHFEMTAAPVAIAGVEVVVEGGASLRSALSSLGLRESDLAGRLIGREELDRVAAPRDFGSAIEHLGIPGVEVSRSENFAGNGSNGVCVHQQRGRTATGMERCGIVVLDGAIVPREIAEGLRPRDLTGIVVLTPVQATQLYGLRGGGGAVLLFTR